MVIRKTIVNGHHIYDAELQGAHYYVYGFSYYDEVYSGKPFIADCERFYLISADVYVKIMTMYRKDKYACECYVYEYIDMDILYSINHNQDSKFLYLGSTRDFCGHPNSAVIQAVIKYLSQKR